METFVISKEELPSEPRDASWREDRPALEIIIGIRNTESFVGSITLYVGDVETIHVGSLYVKRLEKAWRSGDPRTLGAFELARMAVSKQRSRIR